MSAQSQRRESGCLPGLGVLAVVVLVVYAFATDSGSDKKAPAKSHLALHATMASVSAMLVDELGGKAGELPRVRRVHCGGGSCFVAYNADEPAFSPEREVLEAQRPVWKRLFSDPHLNRATLVAYAPLQSVGGRTSQGAALRITCDRAANSQIDWGRVEASGMRRLCDYTPLVHF